MEIPVKDMVPHLVPPNSFRPFDQLYPGWCQSKTRFQVVQLREISHLLKFKASSEDAFILTMVKLAKGYTNIDLLEYFRYFSDIIAGYIY
jgi:hypothetical protein